MRTTYWVWPQKQGSRTTANHQNSYALFTSMWENFISSFNHVPPSGLLIYSDGFRMWKGRTHMVGARATACTDCIQSFRNEVVYGDHRYEIEVWDQEQIVGIDKS